MALLLYSKTIISSGRPNPTRTVWYLEHSFSRIRSALSRDIFPTSTPSFSQRYVRPTTDHQNNGKPKKNPLSSKEQKKVSSIFPWLQLLSSFMAKLATIKCYSNHCAIITYINKDSSRCEKEGGMKEENTPDSEGKNHCWNGTHMHYQKSL